MGTGLELWGGLECTLNRTGKAFRDQSRLSGHHDRLDDLDLFAGVGFKSLRYPLLWERVAPDHPDQRDWRWTDERLVRLQELGIGVIAGLLHHGSGPAYTNLLDEGFAGGLATFAAAVAERYPWIEAWTPVNEPVTTARFSALYGHWYPHHRDERSFWLALLNQVDATRLAMRAVRRVNRGARLIQTDDLGRTYAAPALADQAAFDNLRRWAGWDLLTGRLTPDHPLWERLSAFGFADRLRAIADDPCPPDIIGINHYLTSDRYLDDALDRYPPHLHGGNGRLRYADTEAIRILDPPPAGLRGALREAWDRYQIPLAVTEVHLGCTREEQMRWAAEAWDTAATLRDHGVAIEAVTAWSLLGSRDWDTLLTAPGRAETGLWDVATGTPRPTGLAKLWGGLPHDAPRHPVAHEPGWWHRPERLRFGPRATARRAAPYLLICGATGTLGQAFARACVQRGISHRLVGRKTIDLDRPETIAATLDESRPWAVINAAGWVRVDDAEAAEGDCRRANAVGAIALAAACDARDIPCVAFSSDLVFDGQNGAAYLEGDATAPLNAYGRSKAAMEAALRGFPRALIIRTAAFFSPHDRFNFAVAVADTLGRGQPFHAANDHFISPTFVPDLTSTALDLLIDEATGLWHLTNGEALSWADFAGRIADACALDRRGIAAVAGETLGWLAPRPRWSPLGSSRGPAIGTLDGAIEAFAAHRREAVSA